MLKPAKRKSLRGRLALGMKGLALGVAQGAMMLGGFSSGTSGHDSAKRSTRRTRGWRPGQGSSAADDLPDLDVLRGRSRDLDRNNSLAHGAANTKVNGAIGAGLHLRSVLDAKVLGLDPARVAELQYQIEREWEIFEREADFCGQMHLKDWERVAFRSARVSGDVGVARRWRKRPGETYGTRVVLIEADRISNPNRTADSDRTQGGVQLSADGEIEGWHVSDRHPGDIRGAALKWAFVPRRGPSGMVQMVLAAEIARPGQVRGVPLFAPVEEDLKQLGDYTAAEIKAAINDAYLFAFEKSDAQLDDDGNPILTTPEGQTAGDAGELALEDLTITSLAPGRSVEVKKPERPNTAFDGFVTAFCRHIGVALGIPYELLLMHFAASFSASRGALELAFKTSLIEQAWFIRTVLDQVREWQFTEMVAAGRFDAPGFFDDPIRRAAWLGRVWVGPTRVQINPQVEANADKTDLEMGVKSREQVMTERTGGDFDTKSGQILREREVLGTPGAAPAAEPADDSARNDEKNNDGTDGDEEDSTP